MDETKAPLRSWGGIIKDEQYGDHKLIDMDNRRMCNSNYYRTRAKCWMKQVFCTKWCLNGKVSCTKMSPGLHGWRTYRDAAGPEIVPEKKSGSPTTLFVEGIRVEDNKRKVRREMWGSLRMMRAPQMMTLRRSDLSNSSLLNISGTF